MTLEDMGDRPLQLLLLSSLETDLWGLWRGAKNRQDGKVQRKSSPCDHRTQKQVLEGRVDRSVVGGVLWKETNLGVIRREILGLEVKAANPMMTRALGHMLEISQTPLCSLRIMHGPRAT